MVKLSICCYSILVFLLKYFGISIEIFFISIWMIYVCMGGTCLCVGRLQWNCWFVTKEEASSENNFSKKPWWLYSIWLRILLLQTVTKGGILQISQLRISNWGEILEKNVNPSFGTLKIECCKYIRGKVKREIVMCGRGVIFWISHCRGGTIFTP